MPTPLPGMKFDAAKARWSLIPMSIIEGVVWVYTLGACKYDDDNWQKVNDARASYYGALMRHLHKWWNDGDYTNGEQWDTGPGGFGCHHLLQVVWNAIALCWFEMKRHGRERWDLFIREAPALASELRALRDAKLAKGETR